MTSVLPLPGPIQHLRKFNYTMAVSPFSYATLSLKEAMLDLGVRFILNCPQEDISTSSRLMFQVEEAHWFYEDFAREQNASFPSLQLPGFIESLFRELPVLKALCEDYQQAYAEFKQYKKGIPVRGVIVFNEKYDKVLMVRPYKRQTWGFPRGKINKEEDDKACAVREVIEETGFDCSPYLKGDFFTERIIIGKNFRFYFAGGVPESTVFETRTRKEIDEIKWIPINELRNKNSRKKFFLVTQFIKPVEKFSRSKRGYATDLSQKESDALKNILGVSKASDQLSQNDVESAQQLLAMLKPSNAFNKTETSTITPVNPESSQESYHGTENPSSEPSINAKRQILLGLLQNATPVSTKIKQNPEQNQVEGAKQILALLKREISAQPAPNSVPESNNFSPDINESPITAPMLPPNSMLEQLVSSRIMHPSTKTNLAPRRSENLPRNRLLDILHSSKSPQTRLIDLLAPPKTDSPSASPYSSYYEPRKSNPLMSLLDEEGISIQKSPEKKPVDLSETEAESPSKDFISKDSEEGDILFSLLGASSGAGNINFLFPHEERMSQRDTTIRDTKPQTAEQPSASKAVRTNLPDCGLRRAANKPKRGQRPLKSKGQRHDLRNASSLEKMSDQAPKLYLKCDNLEPSSSLENSELSNLLSEDAYLEPHISHGSQASEIMRQATKMAAFQKIDVPDCALTGSEAKSVQNNKIGKSPTSAANRPEQQEKPQQSAQNSGPKSEQPLYQQLKTSLENDQFSDFQSSHSKKGAPTETVSIERSLMRSPSTTFLAENPLLSLLNDKSAQPSPQ